MPFIPTPETVSWRSRRNDFCNRSWVDQCSFWLVIGCYEYHRPIITNILPPQRFQKSLHPKPVPILLRVSQVGNAATQRPIKQDTFHRFQPQSERKFPGNEVANQQEENHNQLSLLALVYLYWVTPGTQRSLIRRGSPPTSDSLVFYIPFLVDKVLWSLRKPSIDKWYPFNIPSQEPAD